MLDAASLVTQVAHVLFVGGLVSLVLAVATAMVLEQVRR